MLPMPAVQPIMPTIHVAEWSGRVPRTVPFAGRQYPLDNRLYSVREYLQRQLLENVYRIRPCNVWEDALVKATGNVRLAPAGWVSKRYLPRGRHETHLYYPAGGFLHMETYDPAVIVEAVLKADLAYWRRKETLAWKNPLGREAEEIQTSKMGRPPEYDYGPEIEKYVEKLAPLVHEAVAVYQQKIDTAK